MKPASIGTVSHGTLRTEDLLSEFTSELEWQIRRCGEYFSQPENREQANKFNELVGAAQDQWEEDGETLKDEDVASEIVDELQEALGEFAGPYCYFGTHEGDGSDFGFWPSLMEIEELPCYERADEAKEAGETGDFRVVNDHGNVTVYSANGDEIIGIV